MAAVRGPNFIINNVQTFDQAGKAQVIGPIQGDLQLVKAYFNGNTAAVPTVAAGTYVNGVFTSVTSLVNGLDGAGAGLGATRTALQAGVEVALVANGPIASGQYLRIVSGTNTLARYTLEFAPASNAAFATETTPA